MTNTTLSINFYASNITDEARNEFMQAVNHETADMTIAYLNDAISRLQKQADSLRKDIDENGDDEGFSKTRKLDGILANIATNEKAKDKAVEDSEATQEVYDKVVTAMSLRNKDGFGNNKDVVRTVLRVLGSWNNSKLVKYAIIPAFQSPALYEALEAIHVNSVANENGELSMTKEVKEA